MKRGGRRGEKCDKRWEMGDERQKTGGERLESRDGRREKGDENWKTGDGLTR